MLVRQKPKDHVGDRTFHQKLCRATGGLDAPACWARFRDKYVRFFTREQHDLMSVFSNEGSELGVIGMPIGDFDLTDPEAMERDIRIKLASRYRWGYEKEIDLGLIVVLSAYAIIPVSMAGVFIYDVASAAVTGEFTSHNWPILKNGWDNVWGYIKESTTLMPVLGGIYFSLKAGGRIKRAIDYVADEQTRIEYMREPTNKPEHFDEQKLNRMESFLNMDKFLVWTDTIRCILEKAAIGLCIAKLPDVIPLINKFKFSELWELIYRDVPIVLSMGIATILRPVINYFIHKAEDRYGDM